MACRIRVMAARGRTSGAACPRLVGVTSVAAVLICLVVPTRMAAQVTTRVSVASDGSQASADATSRIALSADGRFVAFSSSSPTLVTGDTNDTTDVFVHDRQTGATTRVSVGTDGAQGNGPSSNPAISGDGRFVAFESRASNLVPGDTNGVDDVFVHDCATGETARISVVGGTQVLRPSVGASISGDGHVVAFETTLEEGGRRACVNDRRTRATRCLLSPPPATPPVYGWSFLPSWSEAPSVSADGRFALVKETWVQYGFPYAHELGVVHDLETGATRHTIPGTLAGNAGHVVQDAFGSAVIVEDLQTRVYEGVVVGVDGTAANGKSWSASISADGRFVAFASDASNLVRGDTNGVSDVFVRDRRIGATYRVSVATDGSQAGLDSGGGAISGDGGHVAFASPAPDLVPGDTNGATDVFVHDLDADDDTLPAPWEAAFGLDPRVAAGADGPDGDPDGDGRTNAQEHADGTHPRGFHTRYLAEGATSSFFDTRLALLNPGAMTTALVRFQKRDGTSPSRVVALDGLSRATLDAKAIAGLASAEFATVIESDSPVVVDRQMSWSGPYGGGVYGTHAETASAAPSPTWYLAEGATHHNFSLFYLVQNPQATSVPVTVTYLLPAPAAPLTKAYTVPAHSRFNVWVNEEARTDPALAGLAATDVSAVITAPQPILVERAMYLDHAGPDGQFGTVDDVLFNAGHASAGVTAPATTWLLAEGATGPYFDEFILIANPGAVDAAIDVRYLLPDGRVLVKSYGVPAASRFNIWVNEEEFPGLGKALAETAVSAVVTSTNGVPIIVERAMWWPRPSPFWMEAHNSAGVTATGTRWALAEGEAGGAASTATYILIANTSAYPGTARVTLVFEGGGSASVEVPLAPDSRTNVPAIEDWFPGVTDRRFGALIESLGDTPAQIVVEGAMYSDANGVHWAAGTGATATRLVP